MPKDLGFDLSVSDEELSKLLAGATTGLTDPDEGPEPPAIPVTDLDDLC
jgi:hypothetical protein